MLKVGFFNAAVFGLGEFALTQRPLAIIAIAISFAITAKISEQEIRGGELYLVSWSVVYVTAFLLIWMAGALDLLSAGAIAIGYATWGGTAAWLIGQSDTTVLS